MSASTVVTGTPSRSPSSSRPGRRVIVPSGGGDLGDRGDRDEAGEAHQVDRRLGVAAAHAHAAVDRAERQRRARAG